MAKLILIIDDSRADRLKAATVLSAAGYATLVAADGEAGIASATRQQPDLVLCDIQMPNMDGFAVARCLKQNRATQHIPLIATTDLEMLGDRKNMIGELFDGFLPKPIDSVRFAYQVQSLLDVGARMRRRVPAPQQPSPPQQASAPPARSFGVEARAFPAGAAVAKPAAHDPAGAAPVARLPRILMIDDSGVNIDLFARTMEMEGYETIPCMKSEDAEDLARKYGPDLIVCDIMMPHRDGYAVLQAFKSSPDLRKIPFVIITSSLWPERDREIVSRLGAVKFIHRPIDPPVLAAEIAEVLERPRQPVHLASV